MLHTEKLVIKIQFPDGSILVDNAAVVGNIIFGKFEKKVGLVGSIKWPILKNGKIYRFQLYNQ